jgi:hypothetical protein
VPLYRVYFVDRSGHVSTPPEIVDAIDDQEATQKARQFVDGQDLEVWDESRLVVRIPAGRPPRKGETAVNKK